jgi:hypothetical protein
VVHSAGDQFFDLSDFGCFQWAVEVKVKLQGVHAQGESDQAEGAMTGVVDVVLPQDGNGPLDKLKGSQSVFHGIPFTKGK